VELDLTKVKNIVFLTGAGVSQESGIKTFRDQNGLWENHSIEEVATPEAYERDPALVHRFYNLRRAQLKEVDPNPAHKAIGHLSQYENFNISVITQNVDDLHERGGVTKVLHMHGELRKIRHNHTGEIRYFEGQVEESEFKIWRPDIVWFGEAIKCSEHIPEVISQADLYIAVGTSSQVYPAAGLVSMASAQGIPTVEINLERTNMSSSYNTTLLGKAGEIVPEFIEKHLKVKL
tara:strand:- start:8928 stop:9629 length:702 start_codon:yes stop_codon:yes gene_type:complete